MQEHPLANLGEPCLAAGRVTAAKARGLEIAPTFLALAEVLFAAVHMVGSGTFRPFSNVRYSVVIGGKPDMTGEEIGRE